MVRRRTPRPLAEFRGLRREIAKRQAELERLGRRDAPETGDDEFAVAQWEAEFMNTRTARNRALQEYLIGHVWAALGRIRAARHSETRVGDGSLLERLNAIVRDTDEMPRKSISAVVIRERQAFKKRLAALPGTRSMLVRTIAADLVERELPDRDRAVLAVVLDVPKRVMTHECGHCVRNDLGCSREWPHSTGDGILVCTTCEFTMPTSANRCASCGQEPPSSDP